ncbi:MAG: phosphoglycerate kinase [Candidatus Berkiella sp.]
MITLDKIDIRNKTVLLREDLNVPFDEKGILSTARIDAALETVRLLQEKEAKIILMSHLGRPKGRDEQYTLQPIADYLSEQLKQKVTLFNLGDPLPPLKSRSVALLENVRFYAGETENKETLAKQYAELCDVFVIDAFGVSHRAQASTTGVIQFADEVCMGPLLAKEIAMLNQALENPRRPTVAIVGGGKVSTKLDVLLNLIEKVDVMIVGGALANTFLLAQGKNVGASLVEPELVPMATQILNRAMQLDKTLWLPEDVVVADSIDSASAQVKNLAELTNTDKIFDIGTKAISALEDILLSAQTILWNGPLGVFEREIFQSGTRALAQLIAESNAFSIAGGGETIAAIEKFGVEKQISYISTGGGAFLEVLEGKVLPVITALQERETKINDINTVKL